MLFRSPPLLSSPPVLPSQPGSAQRGPERRPRLSLRARAARARGARVPRVSPAARPRAPGRPGPSCGEAEPPRVAIAGPAAAFRASSAGASDQGSGAASAHRGSGRVGVDWGRGAGRGGSAEMRAGLRAALVFQVTGPPHLPSARGTRRYRRPEAPHGGHARPPGAQGSRPRFGVAPPAPPARPCPLPSLILPLLGKAAGLLVR